MLGEHRTVNLKERKEHRTVNAGGGSGGRGGGWRSIEPKEHRTANARG